MRLVLIAAAVASTLASAGASAAPVEIYGYRPAVRYAQRIGVRPPVGWYGGFGGTGTALVRQVGGPEQLGAGGGAMAFGGVHVHPRAAIEVAWSESFHNPARVQSTYGAVDWLVLDGLSVGVRAYLAGVEPAVSPYLMAGIGAYGLGSDWFGPQASGTGFHLGVGADAWLGDVMAVGLRARYRGIAMESVDDQHANSYISILGVELGLSFHL